MPVELVSEIVPLSKSNEKWDSVVDVILLLSITLETVKSLRLKAETAVKDNTKATTANNEINVLFMLMCCNSLITMVFKYFYDGVFRLFLFNFFLGGIRESFK